jgi:hypothetical protein
MFKDIPFPIEEIRFGASLEGESHGNNSDKC